MKFPVLEKLVISGFGLYPGIDQSGRIELNFNSGMTLIVGANGLGKTTLVTIIYRLLSGPFDIPALSNSKELGNADLQATPLSAQKRKVFANRVSDSARTSSARLSFSLGGKKLLIERNLYDLKIAAFEIDGQQFEANEQAFQSEISKLAGVWAFGDWILLLRHLIFYFEDRRALVWDPSAQRQMLRFLFLSKSNSQKWSEDEREILILDSRMRNLRAAVFKEEQSLSTSELKASNAIEVVEELKTLEHLQKEEMTSRDVHSNELTELDATRKQLSLRLLQAKQQRENLYRAYEHAKLKAVESRFPAKSDTTRYIYEHLFAEQNCLVCGNHAPKAAKNLAKRITSCSCIVCGTDVSDTAGEIISTELADKRLKKANRALEKFEPELSEAIALENEIQKSFAKSLNEFTKLDSAISSRTEAIDALIRQLPPDEVEMHEQRRELATMRNRVEKLADQLEEKRGHFSQFVSSENRKMAKAARGISEAFQRYASGFLLESVKLVWSPQSYKLGQSGEPIEFPAFELEMTGANFSSLVRRNGPDQVSESQREFIDLAFRMALMEVSSKTGTSSLVIDAPESSLDAVFVGRAARVLIKYAQSKADNRLIITSNLIEGDLLPSLLSQSTRSKDVEDRLIDLFSIAEPTAAVRELSAEYLQLMNNLKQKANRISENGDQSSDRYN